MSEENLYRIPDGNVLRPLPNGLFIVRRRKHEYSTDLDGLSRRELALLTDKRRGSKFSSAWDSLRVCDWIEQEVISAGWTAELQEPHPLIISLQEEVGFVKGNSVHTICIRSDGRNIHAYPVEDRHE